MKIAVCRKKDGGVALVRICNKKGEIIHKGDLDEHLQSVVAANGFVSYRIADVSDLPKGEGDSYDRTFVNAFTDDYEGSQIDIDLDKAKVCVAHARRRCKRSALFANVDSDNPNLQLNPEGEVLRSKIKSDDDALQVEIDACKDITELEEVMRKGCLL